MSGRLITKGWSTDRARKSVVLLGAVLMTAGIPAALTSDAMVALALISLVTFGFQSWINNVQTLPSDYFPEEIVASVAGLGGVGAGIGAILYVLTTGWLVDHFLTPRFCLSQACYHYLVLRCFFSLGDASGLYLCRAETMILNF